MPQGSILGSILFNIFLCDILVMTDNIHSASYADDNTPHSVGKKPVWPRNKIAKDISQTF